MGEADADDEVWQPLDYDSAWSPFHSRFGFAPDYYERDVPPIALPPNSVVVDLASIFEHQGARFAAGEAAVNAAALRAFVRLADDHEVLALDWQHPAYRYRPAAHALTGAHWPVPVFPNGDYYAHMTRDMQWGTFGHPWQQTLCIWGEKLVGSLGAELLTWLPART